MMVLQSETVETPDAAALQLTPADEYFMFSCQAG